MSSAVINVPKVPSMDTSMFTNNRSKLLKLAEGIKTKKKPSHNKKAAVNFKKEPGYANIEHLVFGTYRPKNSPNNLTNNSENSAYNNPNESLISVNGGGNPPFVLLNNKASPSPTTFRRTSSHGQQLILESLTEDRQSPNPVELSSDCLESEFTTLTGIFSQANSVTAKPRSPLPSPVLQSRIPSANKAQVVNNLIDYDDILHHADEAPFVEPAITTLCSGLCSPIVRHKQLENGYSDQIEHPGIVKSKSLENAVHSPPVHLLTQSKFITQEFSADSHTPDMPVVANKNGHSIKKLQVQGAVVTVAPSRLCSNTTQSSSRGKSRTASSATAKAAPNPTNKFGEISKDTERGNPPSQRDKISNASASVRLHNSGKMTGAFKRLSPARSSSVGISSASYSSPLRALSLDDSNSHHKTCDSPSVSATCTSRRQSYLKTKSASNDGATTVATTHAFGELKSRVLPPLPSSLQVTDKSGTAEPDLRHQGASKVTTKLSEVYSTSRLRKVSGIDCNAVAGEGENLNPLISEVLMTAHTNSPHHTDTHYSPTQKALIHSKSEPIVRASSPEISRPLSTCVQTMPKVLVSTTSPARPTISTHVKIVVSKEGVGKPNNSEQGVKTEFGNKKAVPVKQKSGPKLSSYDQSRSSTPSIKSNLASQKSSSAGAKQTTNASSTATKPSARPRTISAPPSAVSNLMVRGRSSSSCSLSGGRKFGSASSSLAGSQVSLCSTTNIRANVRNGDKNNDINVRRSFHAGAISGRETGLGRPMSSMRAPSNKAGGMPSRGLSASNKPPVCPAKVVEKSRSNSIPDGGVNNRGKLPSTGNNAKSGILKPSVNKEPNKRLKRPNDTLAEQSVIDKCQDKRNSVQVEKPINQIEETEQVIKSSPNLSCLLNLKLVDGPAFDEIDKCSAKATAESLDQLLADLAAHAAPETGPDFRLTDQLIKQSIGNITTTSELDEIEKVVSQVPAKGHLPRRSISLPGATLLSPTHTNNFSNSIASPIVSPRRPPPARSLSVTGPSYSLYNDCNLTLGFELKDFAIPHQDFSQTSPSANVSRRSSSCSDRTKEDLHICQSNSPEVNEISTVPLKNSWFLVEDDDGAAKKAGAGCQHQVAEEVRVSDLNESSVVRTSPPIDFEDVDVVSSAVNVSDAVNEQHKTGFKPVKERNVPKCVRRVKAASSPSFTDARTDSWVSEGDLRRPWSQICSEQDVERLVQARSCGMGSGSMATGIDVIVQMHPSTTDLASDSGSTSAVSSAPSSSSGSSQGSTFGGRFSSMRTPSTRPPGSPVEGVLQKFRKSFSARFYKKVKAESPPSPSNVSISARHASFSSYLNDHLGSESLSTNGSIAALNSGDVVIGDPGATDNSTVFRLGPIVWRSSKEKKGKKMKKRSIGGDSLGDDKIETVESSSKDHLDSHTKSFTSNGSTITLINHPHPNGYPPGIAVVSPRLFPRRAHSTSLRSERPKRPLSEQGSSLYGSINLPDVNKMSVAGDSVNHGSPMRSCHLRNGSLFQVTASTTGLPPRIVVRREKLPTLRWTRERTNLRRSISQPLEIERLGAMGLSHSPAGLSDQEDHDLSSASSDDDIGSDGEFGGGHRNRFQRNGNFYLEYSEPVMLAEALWDHVTLDSEELPLKAGDLVEVLDKADSEWWWGIKGSQAGWFPASFVRIRVNQEDTVEDCFVKMENGAICSPSNRKMSMSLLSTDQVRTKVIMEIFNTERDFVQHLKDVCEGYLKQMRKRPDMFSEERLNIIFGNVEQLFTFQSLFVSELEQCINWEKPQQSEIGSCFIKHKDGFEIYSEYCNNHPQAVNELQQLYAIPKYAHFFEACRLLQDMIDIALDGFLLTPVQKICKYPLQLGELLKYTKTDHPDYCNVEEALKTMRNVAQYINERKRRMECLEKLAAWQTEVEDWEGYDLLDHSSELIYSGDVYKVTTAWSRDFTLFLFDHQLMICKKDLLKRHSYTYKNRISVDNCKIETISDGKDVHSGLTLKNAWKVFCAERSKWYIFATRTPEEKSRWMKAFSDERRRVSEDRQNGFVVSEKAKKMAAMVVQNKKKPKKPKDKENKDFNRRMSRPEAYAMTSKSGSLPSNVAFTTNKKKTSSGWFHFGSNKKTKR